jgi:recombinational DNA repair ATPase RecF
MATSAARCSRWHLSAVRVRGFKSFGSSWVHVPLPSAHLVGLLGPNGSGKSNLLEAVLFAVGCPATTLRVRTLRELASSDAPDSVGHLGRWVCGSLGRRVVEFVASGGRAVWPGISERHLAFGEM